MPLHGDARGTVKENWQRAKMTALGLPDFGPVQHTVSSNASAGVTRGFHAEPWDKLVSVASGRVFGAWVDLREGSSFGTVVTAEIDPGVSVFVPRGVANSFQTLEPTVYSYLVNDHWSPEATAEYTYLNLADERVAIDWPIPLDRAIISDADRAHPRLGDVVPMRPKATVVLGASGQLGRALRDVFPGATFLTRDDVDLADAGSVSSHTWRGVGTIINAAAYTAVDAAETPEGRAAAWATNVTGLAALAEVARTHRARLVHVSSDYVFDGTRPAHTTDEPLSPLGVYGQTKAAGEAIVASVPGSLIVRTSWVVGDGANFVDTMASLAARGVSPSVVDDQVGRLTFASDLARAIAHLLNVGATGIVHVTNDGPPMSWFDIARRVFELSGRSPDDVTPVSTAEYSSGRTMAPRPANSVLDLSSLVATGFVPPDADAALVGHLRGAR